MWPLLPAIGVFWLLRFCSEITMIGVEMVAMSDLSQKSNTLCKRPNECVLRGLSGPAALHE